MLLLSIELKLLLLQMLAISKFNFETTSLESLCICRTLETKLWLIPCVLHLAAMFRVFCIKPSVSVVLFNKSFIPTLLSQSELLQVLV